MARRIALLLIANVLAFTTSAGASAPAEHVEHQAWTRAMPLGTFEAQEDHIYVAATVGFEEARAFVLLTPAVADHEEPTLTFTEADDSLDGTAPAVIACMLDGPLTESGELDPDEAPEVDCTTRTNVTRNEAGLWTVNLGVFIEPWRSGSPPGLSLIADLAEKTPNAYRLSFDASATALHGDANVAETSTAPERPNATDELAPSPLDPPVGSALPESMTPVSPEGTTRASPNPPATPDSGSNQTPATTAPTSLPELAIRPNGTQSMGPSAVTLFLVLAVVTAAVVSWLLLRRRIEVPARLQGPKGIGALGYGLIGVAALLPMVGSQLAIFRAGLVVVFIVAALGLHLLVNWAGELSLAHAAVVGLPAFVVATASEVGGISPVYLLPVGIVTGAAVGLLVALPVLRSRGLVVALVTLIAGRAIESFFFTQQWLSPRAGRVASGVTLGPLNLATPRTLYPLLVLLAGTAIAGAWILLHSKVARGWFWLRADPSAAAAFGIPVVRYRIAAYVISGIFAGFAGALTVMWLQRLSPSAFPSTLSVTYLVVAVIAGPGFVGGIAVAGAALEGGRLFSSGTGGLIAYLGPIALVLTITRYEAGLNGMGRKLMERLVGKINTQRGTGQTYRPDAINLSFIGGVLAMIAGFLAIGLAWYHAGNTNQLWIQNQEMISGGLGGLALVLTGIGLLIRDRLIHVQRALAHRLDVPADDDVGPPTDRMVADDEGPLHEITKTPRRRRVLAAR